MILIPFCGSAKGDLSFLTVLLSCHDSVRCNIRRLQLAHYRDCPPLCPLCLAPNIQDNPIIPCWCLLSPPDSERRIMVLRAPGCIPRWCTLVLKHRGCTEHAELPDLQDAVYSLHTAHKRGNISAYKWWKSVVVKCHIDYVLSAKPSLSSAPFANLFLNRRPRFTPPGVAWKHQSFHCCI